MDDFKFVEKILRNTKGATGENFFSNEQSSELKVTLLADSKIGSAKFKKHSFLHAHFYAHPDTIRALKSDLFLLGEDFVDLEQPYQCQSCKFDLDLQFWRLCPRCGAHPSSDISRGEGS